MSDIERDEVISRALRDLPVPEHRPDFWAELDRTLVAAPPPAAAPATGDLPPVTALAERRKRRTPLVAGAAAAALLLIVVGVVLLGGDDGGDDAEVAQAPEPTTTVTVASTIAPTTTAAPEAPAPAADAPEQVATEWLDALGTGDIATAAALTGPRSAAYVGTLGPEATLEGVLTESQEDLGGWAGTEDREITASSIGPMEFDGGTLHVVTVRGTYSGEGGDGTLRVEVLPMVDDGEGFRVEHLAFAAGRENEPVLTVPDETDTGLAPVDPAAEINVFLPAAGTVWFELDGGPAESDVTSEVAEEPFALHDPPGDLAPGPHQLVVVALGEDGTIAHYGGTFVVEP